MSCDGSPEKSCCKARPTASTWHIMQCYMPQGLCNSCLVPGSCYTGMHALVLYAATQQVAFTARSCCPQAGDVVLELSCSAAVTNCGYKLLLQAAVTSCSYNRCIARAYRRGLWYWDTVVLLQTFALATALVFCTALDAHFQISTMLLILVFGLTVLASVRPFEETVTQHIQVCTAACISA